MRTIWGLLVIAGLAAKLSDAQSIKVYSEFQRINASGEVVAADRGDRPREILSPAVARNAFASFHAAVSLPADMPAFLYVQQNPEIFQITVYRESFVQSGKEWIPDGLRKVALPYQMALPQAPPIQGQKVIPFWIDLWAPVEAPVARVRVEVLAKVGERWVAYPMEVRVTSAMALPVKWSPFPVAPVREPVDATVFSPWKNYACGVEEAPGRPGPLTVRQLIRRNALQDISLARGRGGLLAHDFCKPTERSGAEWYLRVRDTLLLRKN